MKRNWKRKIPLIVLVSLAAVTAFSGLVMVLWNGILPQVLHAGVITFWQAAGLLLLGRLLFGGFRGRRRRMMGGCGDYQSRHWARKEYCKQPTPAQE